ncbi:MAG: glycosyltransferase family 4 protein [Candidatus Eisenbacteria bacterium]|nr:glycosyltransferase family 4 protein [Candidatus Eisenbacteria bacterium]
MKKILGLSSIPIDENLGAGAERIGSLYRHLPDAYERTLVSLTGLRGPAGERRLPGGVLEIRLRSPLQTLFYYIERMRAVPFFHVSAAHDLFPGAAARRLREEWDLVQFDSLWLTPWMRRVPRGIPVVYGSHNFESDWYEGEIRRFLFPRVHAAKLAALERNAVLRADRVLATTKEDREKFVRAFGANPEKIAVVPNGFDEERFRPATDEEKRAIRARLGLPAARRIALFAGSDVSPNRDAVESILRAIAPHAPAGVLFLVAGGIGRAFERSASDRVFFTGPVPDIVPYFRAADIGLNPIRFGSGSNIKVLQYLGSGLPVISTAFGMRGFDDLLEHVTVARVDRFSYHLDRVEPDPEATRLARERHGWRNASVRLAEVYADLLGEASS